MRKVLAATTGATVLAGVLAVSTAVAAPGGGSSTPPPAPPAPTPGPAVEGILDGGTRAKQDGITLRTRDDALVRTFTLTYPPLAESGWHEHPGIVLATVESGKVVQRVGCDRNVWKKGQSFTEVEAHLIRNPSKTKPAVLRITQIAPEDVPLRENVEPPRC
jgi:quercetin dioxygenase-like cupin family protein